MSKWIRELSSDGQLRWIGPEKGVIHLATAAIVNAFWDLWAKQEKKPVWKLLVDMTPEQIISLIDFRFLTHLLLQQQQMRHVKQMFIQTKNVSHELLACIQIVRRRVDFNGNG